eukprot:CAMPEP_0195056400 /NCGR_PEP_ID=MMETSP0448-20130528/4810_1 /TAXON_ID=66468 /ORGANISM="Heterocapsa triquestra, Strain CCMP 448" /LENGTH=356 /DNA_ID=CAMNT_0040086221 /DNA_START=59 /DNA_END=1132 /DNA_ORIENTATION=-
MVPEEASGIALPARVLRARLRWVAEPPSWFAYLPPQLQQPESHFDARPAVHGAWPNEVRAAEDGRAGGGQGAGHEPWWCGRIWGLSRDPRGCWEVQQLLESVSAEEERVAIAAELRGHICEAARCPHANYVLQHCIKVMKPNSVQFMIDELTFKGPGAVSQAARHKYGCRIVQRLLEFCPPAQVKKLADGLLHDVVALSLHPYGNYVMQHLLAHGTAEQQRHLARLLAEHAAEVSGHACGCAVMGKAMELCGHEDQAAIARVLLNSPGGLSSVMARTRLGHKASKLVLQVLEGPAREEAYRQIGLLPQSGRGMRSFGLASSGESSRCSSAGTAGDFTEGNHTAVGYVGTVGGMGGA